MSNKLYEGLRSSVPLPPTSISNTNVTGKYIPVTGCRRLIAVLANGAAAVSKTVKLELLAATDSAGTGADSLASATATANTKVKAVTITLTSAADTDKVEVNGVEYARGSGAGNFANAAALIVLLNARAGLKATANAEVITLEAEDGYSLTVVGTDVAGTVVVATLSSIVQVEVSEDQLIGFTHVAPKVTSTGAGYATVVFIQEMKVLPVSLDNLAAQYPA